MTCKGTLRQVFHLFEAHSPPMTPILPPYTLYTCLLIHIGKGGGELTREKVRCAMLHKAVRKYQHDCPYLQSINSIKHTFRVCCLYSYFSPRCKIYIVIYNTSHSVCRTVHSVAHSLFWTLIRTSSVN
jgi:hypothetical protein